MDTSACIEWHACIDLIIGGNIGFYLVIPLLKLTPPHVCWSHQFVQVVPRCRSIGQAMFARVDAFDRRVFAKFAHRLK